MILFQLTVETFRFNFFKCKWVQKSLYPSSSVFPSAGLADSYTKEYTDGLRRRGIKLKEGRYKIHISTLKCNFI